MESTAPEANENESFMTTHEYVIVAMLDPLEERTVFAAAAWPLHTTFVGPFSIDTTKLSTVVNDIRTIFAKGNPLRVTISGDALFGPQRDISVSLVEPTTQLMTLHERLFETLSEYGASFRSPEYTGAGFRPHVTVQRHGRVDQGQQFALHTVSFVDMAPGNDSSHRKVLHNFAVEKD